MYSNEEAVYDHMNEMRDEYMREERDQEEDRMTVEEIKNDEIAREEAEYERNADFAREALMGAI